MDIENFQNNSEEYKYYNIMIKVFSVINLFICIICLAMKLYDNLYSFHFYFNVFFHCCPNK